METRTNINKEVNVTALYFHNRRNLKSFPKRMEYDGRQYEFVESGMQYQITKDNQEVRLFDMTDGSATYRLKFDYGQFTWTLVSISRSIFSFSN